MNQQNNEKCPVCHYEMAPCDELCPECGWLRLVYPSQLPEVLKTIEDKRLHLAQQQYEAWKTTQKNELQYQKTVDELRQSKVAFQQQYEVAFKQQEQLKICLADRENELYTLRQQQQGFSEQQGRIHELEVQIRDLSSRLAVSLSEQKQLREQLREAQLRANSRTGSKQGISERNITGQGNLSHSQVDTSRSLTRATVQMTYQGRSMDFPLYVGENVFGTVAQSLDGYRQIYPNHPLQQSLFRIVVKDQLFVLYDLCGRMVKANGRLVGHKEVELNGYVILTVEGIKIQIDIPEVDWEGMDF